MKTKTTWKAKAIWDKKRQTIGVLTSDVLLNPFAIFDLMEEGVDSVELVDVEIKII